jgi:amino acid transporter
MQPSDEGLRKIIGVRTLAANTVNLTLGAGIFALPAVVASYMGGAAFIAYLICTVLILLVILCYIEAGANVTKTGGVYVYVENAFGPMAGFLSSTLYGFGYCLMADAAIANVVTDSLAVFLPALKQPVYRIAFMFLIFGGIAGINVRGVKQGTWLAIAVTIAKLVPLLTLVAVGIFYVDTTHYTVGRWPDVQQLGEVSIILFFAFGGMECSLGAGGEIKNPRYTVPRGMLLGALTIFVLYVSLHVVVQGVLGADLTQHMEAPLAATAYRIMGLPGETLLVLGAAISGLGLIVGDILVTSRMPYAAARDGLLPSALARIHPRYATPFVSIVFYAGLGFLVAISGGFRQLALLSSSALLLTYLGVIFATLKLRTRPAVPGAFRLPGGVIVPLLAALTTGWFLTNLARKELLIAVVFLATVTAIYLVMNETRKRLRR